MIPIYTPLAVLLVAGFLTPLIGIKLKLFRRVLVTTVLLFSFFFWVSLMPTVFSGEVLVYNMNEWAPPFGITLAIDSFSIVFLVFVSGMGLFMSPIIERFVKHRRSEFYSLYLLLMVGMTGILMTGDLFNLFVFTEILVISSYSLTIFFRDDKSLEAGIKYIVVGAFASSLILLGITLLYGQTGTLNMADLMRKITLKDSIVPLGLIMAGYLTEMGVVPFHLWKPDVVEAVTPPLAAIIVSVSTSVAAYAMMRILFVFGFIQINYLLMALGMVSMIVGAFMALFQEDLRRMLAYSSVSQMGYILFAFSLGSVGLGAGIFHMLNNILLKMIMFLIVGSIIYKRNEIKPVNMPITGFCFLVASLGIAGIPPMNGFASKLMIYEVGFYTGFAIPTLLAIIFSVVTLAYYLKAFGNIFTGSVGKMKEDKIFLVPIIVLTFFCVILGVFPKIALDFIDPIVKSLLSGEVYYCSVFGC